MPLVLEILWYYRISGDVIDLASLISEVCDLMQFDWLIQLEDRAGRPRPTLMLKLIDRSELPKGNVISTYIANAKDSKTLISSNYGKELSTATTAKVVSGGPVSRYLEQGIGNAVPMWGRSTGDSWNVHPNMSSASSIYSVANLINPKKFFTLFLPTGGQWNITLFELRMLTGSQPKESWQLFKTFQSIANEEPNGYNGEDGLERAPWYAKSQINEDQLRRLANGEPIPKQDMQQTSLSESEKRAEDRRQQELDELYNWISSVAESFCRDFMVSVPADAHVAGSLNQENIRWVNTYGDSTIKRYQNAWDVVGDAWSNNPWISRADFYNNGRLKAMAGFPDAVSTGAWGSNSAGAIPMDMSDLGESAFKTSGQVYTLGAGPAEEEIYNIQETLYVPYSVDANPLAVDDWTTPIFWYKFIS